MSISLFFSVYLFVQCSTNCSYVFIICNGLHLVFELVNSWLERSTMWPITEVGKKKTQSHYSGKVDLFRVDWAIRYLQLPSIYMHPEEQQTGSKWIFHYFKKFPLK
jgi:hypothetical protein